MPLDSSIYQRFAPKSVAQYDQEAYAAEGARQGNALNQLAMAGRQFELQEAQATGRERNALAALLTRPDFDRTSPDAPRQLYGVAPRLAADTIKGWQGQDKTAADIAKDKATAVKTQGETVDATIKRYRGALDYIDTPAGAVRWLQAQYDDKDLGPHMQALGPLDAALQQIPQDPQAFAQWRQQVGLGMDTYVQRQGEAEQRKQTATRDAETAANNQRVDERVRSEGAANRAVTLRGQNMVDARAGASAAESQEPSGNDRRALSIQLGVPMAEADPWRGMSQKGKEASQRSVRTAADKRIGELEQAASDAAAMHQDVARFLELQGTDGITAQGPLMGRTPAISAHAQEMDAIADRLTPKMREPGSGATSDFDARMFRSATVGRTKQPEANAAIAEAVKARAQVLQDRAQFMRDYLTVNGHLDGAERQWRSYLEANPIFDRRSQTPKINPNRSSYKQFFAGGASTPAAGAPPQPGVAPKVVDFGSLR